MPIPHFHAATRASPVRRWPPDLDSSATGPISTTEVYTAYLRTVEETAVPRKPFLKDLASLGVEEVIDGDEFILLRK